MKHGTRLMSLALAALLCLSLLPMGALASPEPETENTEIEAAPAQEPEETPEAEKAPDAEETEAPLASEPAEDGDTAPVQAAEADAEDTPDLEPEDADPVPQPDPAEVTDAPEEIPALDGDTIYLNGQHSWAELDRSTGVIRLYGDQEMGRWSTYDSVKKNVKTAVIEEGVTSISLSVFNQMTLTSVTIPVSVTRIEANAFKSSAATLQEVNYAGTDEQWYAMDIGSGNDILWKLKGLTPAGLSGSCGADTSWAIADGVLTVSGTGAVTEAPWKDHTAWFSSAVVKDGVTDLPRDAFRECVLTSVSLPEGLTSLPVAAFSYCRQLKEISLPASLTAIGRGAFAYCYELEEITLPSGLRSVEASAFSGCSNLKTLHYGGTAEDWEEVEIGTDNYWLHETAKAAGLSYHVGGTLGEDILWRIDGDGVLTITGTGTVKRTGSALFPDDYPWKKELYRVTSVVIGEGIDGIDGYAFDRGGYEMSSVTSITIPASVTYIGPSIFGYNPEKLERAEYAGSEADWYAMEIDSSNAELWKCVGFSPRLSGPAGDSSTWTLADGVLRFEGAGVVKWSPYSYAYAVKEVVVGEGITALDGKQGTHNVGLFEECKNLTKVTLPQSLTAIGRHTFYRCIALEEIDIPDGVTDIGDEAFCICTHLARVDWPSSLKTLGYAAFSNCLALPDPALPEGLISIGRYAFFNTPIINMDMPDSVTEIGECAFEYCFGIERFHIPAGVSELPTILLSAGPLIEPVTIPATVTKLDETALTTVSCMTVIFEGPAPEFHESAFLGSFICYYPADDPTWTEEVRGQYGAHILWLPIGGEIDVPPDTPLDDSGPLTALERVDIDSLDYARRQTAGANGKYNTWYQQLIYGDYGENTACYLLENDDGGLTLVECVTGNGEPILSVEIYDQDKNLVWTGRLPVELPLWGGFYAGTDYNFLVFGQKNPEEDDSAEVIRVVRYTKNWHRVDSVSLYGANTIIPFEAGSLSMVQSGDVLHIHTCHEMYKSDDGLNHQANLDFDVLIPQMAITSSLSTISNPNKTGYVSHSFDQFILADGFHIITLDHGDAYPRALTMYRYSFDAGSPFRAVEDGGDRVNVFPLYGLLGDNTTGATVGSFAASDSSYLVAGNSLKQGGGTTNIHTEQRNIFVTATDKEAFTADATEVKWITAYEKDAGVFVSEPKLVKLPGDSFLLLWAENVNTVKYLFLDGKGDPASDTYAMTGKIGDGQPIVMDSKVVWYASGLVESGDRGDVVTPTVPILYSIDLTDAAKTEEIPLGPLPTPAPDRPGDVNRDGLVDRADRGLLARHLTRADAYPIPEEKAADMNEDGTVDRTDRILLARELAGSPAA